MRVSWVETGWLAVEQNDCARRFARMSPQLLGGVQHTRTLGKSRHRSTILFCDDCWNAVRAVRGRRKSISATYCCCVYDSSSRVSEPVIFSVRPALRDISIPLTSNRSDIFLLCDAVRGNRPGKPVQLAEYEIKYLCTKAREIFINQPILLELEAPIKICGE